MWVTIISALILYTIYINTLRRSSYPPGPIAVPIVGNLISVWYSLKKYKLNHLVWKNWSKKYGNILGLRLGVLNVVIVFGKDLIKEVSMREVFDGRPDGFLFLIRSFGKQLGIAFSEGKRWTKSRRFVLKCLKNFGFGSRSMEVNITRECERLVDYLLNVSNKPVIVNQIFEVLIVNILWQLIAGTRYDIEDEKLKKMCDLINRSFKAANMSGGILSFLPFIRHIMPDLSGYAENKKLRNEIRDFIQETIQRHKMTIDITNPRDVIDMLLINMMQNKDDNFTQEEVHVICLDLLEAGVETVNNTVAFLILYLLRNEEVQRQLQREIDTKIGFSRKPTLDDRPRMIYTEAVLMEALRMSSVAALSIAHKALADTELAGYIIPKGSYVLMSLHDLHNGDHWTDPTTFRPERFIGADKKLLHTEDLIPFGIGRRRCIGEGLARSEMFMFLTYLLQRFNLKLPEGEPLPSTQPEDGLTLSPKEFIVIFEPRY